MALSDAKVNLVCGPIAAPSINASIAAPRLVALTIANQGTTISSALIPGLTATAKVFVQQVGAAAAVPVAVTITAVQGPPAGFAIPLTTAAVAAATDFICWIASYA